MEPSENRLVYLDNLRNIMVFAVVAFHAACMFAYPLAFYWPVIDTGRSSRIFETLILTMDIFLMPVLLFIAALFIVPSLRCRSAVEYIKKRFRRLIVPIMVFTFCAGDIFHQLLLARLGAQPSEYAGIFLAYWRDFADFSAITFIGKDKMLNQVSFNMLHLWFLSLLFFLTLGVVAARAAFRKRKETLRKIDTRKKVIIKTVFFAIISGFMYCAISIWLSVNDINVGEWVRLFGLVQVRVNQLYMLLPVFFFGLYVQRKEWLVRGDIGSWKIWGILSLVFMMLITAVTYSRYLPLVESFIRAYEHNLIFAEKVPSPVVTQEFSQAFTLVNLLQMPACIFTLMFFLAFAKTFFNRPNAVTEFLSKHSINVYIFHYVPVILMQNSFLQMNFNPLITIIAITMVAIPACLWLSHRLVYPHPAAAITVFVLLKLTALAVGFGFYRKALLVILGISFAGAIFETVRFAVRQGMKGNNTVTASR